MFIVHVLPDFALERSGRPLKRLESPRVRAPDTDAFVLRCNTKLRFPTRISGKSKAELIQTCSSSVTDAKLLSLYRCVKRALTGRQACLYSAEVYSTAIN